MMKDAPNGAGGWMGGLLAVIALVALFAGCGPLELDQCPPGDPDCDTACEGGCPAGQRCVSGSCVGTGSGGLQCGEAGEACSPMAASSEGFLCIDWDGEGARAPMCSGLCDDDGSCPSGSSCFVLNSSFDADCQDASDCRSDMMCIQGTCRYTACQPSECSGVMDGHDACDQKYADDPDFADGARCVELDNQANHCVPAGRRELGEQCIGAEAAVEQQDFASTCAAGLGCVGGTCRQPCRFDEDCDGQETCTIADDGNLGDGVGFCAHTCTPFEEDSCDDGQMCEPVTADAGHCVSTGTTPAFSTCTPGERQCESGTLCVEYASGGDPSEARCHPVCDLSAGGQGEDATQAERDATCPQSPPAPASLRIAHLAETLGPVDVYLVGEDDALVEELGFEAAYPSDGGSASDRGWHEVEPGRYRVAAVAAGAPRTDRRLVDVTVDLGSGVGKAVYIAPPPPASSDDAQAAVVEAAGPQERTDETDIRVVHLLADAGRVDVVALPAGHDPAEAAAQDVLAEGVDFGEGGATRSVQAGQLRVLAFAAGGDRSDPQAAILDYEAQVDGDGTLVLRGTVDPDDYYSAARPTILPLGAPPTSAPRGPRFSCTALESSAHGYCQQVCGGGAEDFDGDTCMGEDMGCAATEFPDRGEWLSLCAPVGDAESGAACDPARPHGQCAEGLYCLEYGAGAAPVSGVSTGRCTPLCEVEGDENGPLGCDEGQSCEPVVHDGSYDIGQCGWACEPGEDYADSSCPQGLESCTPVASLHEGSSGQQAPVVRDEQPFCSPSGLRGPGEVCGVYDCRPGTECLYPRSEQTDLTSTVLSPYFGAGGQAPTCKPQCDPFDGDDAAAQCAAGETCLPNYPWSSEVGHCAPIEEQVQPLEPCTKPGLSCGEDSICVAYPAGQECFRFCDYLGADAQGAYHQSSCPSGMICEPFVQDIGRCVSP